MRHQRHDRRSDAEVGDGDQQDQRGRRTPDAEPVGSKRLEDPREHQKCSKDGDEALGDPGGRGQGHATLPLADEKT